LNWFFFFLCSKEKPNDAEAFRLLGEVKYELKDYEGSVVAYKDSAKVSLLNDFKHFLWVGCLKLLSKLNGFNLLLVKMPTIQFIVQFNMGFNDQVVLFFYNFFGHVYSVRYLLQYMHISFSEIYLLDIIEKIHMLSPNYLSFWANRFMKKIGASMTI
jgi:hypothetical protein